MAVDVNKTVFVSYASQDGDKREQLKRQPLKSLAELKYVHRHGEANQDLSWREIIRARIRRSDGVIALISKNSVTSSMLKWELHCAQQERKKVLGVWVNHGDRTRLTGVDTTVWRSSSIEQFIISL